MRDLLLIGGGHAHALVLRHWAAGGAPPARITLVNPAPSAPYTGMLPGHVAGLYPREALEIDLQALANAPGAALLVDRVVGLDPDAGLARLESGAEAPFDVASIDIGVASHPPGLGEAEGLAAAKPLGGFAEAWRAYLAEVEAGTAGRSVLTIGGGVGGVELTLAMAARLGPGARVTLLEAGADIVPGASGALRRRLKAALRARGISVEAGAAVEAVEPGRARRADGRIFEADFIAAASGARPAAWLAETGLALRGGFVRVDRTLRSVSHAHVFAVGDIAHMDASPRERAGVFAVRQAPVLAENLTAAIEGGGLKAFRPQEDYLKLVSLGDGRAVAAKWGLALSGRLMWALKDRIDRRFMKDLSV